MKILDKLKNNFLYNNKYKTHSEAVIIACYFNPQNNPYRLRAFRIFYESIKHLNYQIVECVIGDSKPELVNEFPSLNITRVYTQSLLWHKEGLLNKVVRELPIQYKYIFWLDTDVIFTNNDWLVDSVNQLKNGMNIIQPFEYCVHLEQDETEPNFDITHEYEFASNPKNRHPKLWKSFGANHVQGNSSNINYDMHGHVGFAWGAKRSVLDAVPLYDRALIGGADHIIAHAAAGHFNHPCIAKSFTDNIKEVEDWSKQFYYLVRGKIGYVKGDLYHFWHGDLAKRQYLKRIQEFTPTANNITKKDKNGLHVTDSDDAYVKQYFNQREFKTVKSQQEIENKRKEYQMKYPDSDDSFIESLLWGYITDSSVMGTMMGGNIAGAIMGEMLNDNDQQNNIDSGGEFGGAGSGGTYEVDNNQQDSTQVDDNNVTSDNFS
jgi:hypothetical protein